MFSTPKHGNKERYDGSSRHNIIHCPFRFEHRNWMEPLNSHQLGLWCPWIMMHHRYAFLQWLLFRSCNLAAFLAVKCWHWTGILQLRTHHSTFDSIWCTKNSTNQTTTHSVESALSKTLKTSSESTESEPINLWSVTSKDTNRSQSVLKSP